MPSIVNRVVHWGSQPKAQSPAQANLCEICGQKPKFVEGGVQHSYCSRSCARNGQGPSPSVCMLQGCRSTGKPAFSNFCSETHAKEGVRLGQVEGCKQCNTQPRTVGELCLSCERRSRSGPRLRELNADGTTFKNLRAQFLSEWESPDSDPTFEKVYEVILPRDTRSKHEAYRLKHAHAEEIRTFHSSQCICDLGFKNATLCNFKSCGICMIVKSSFKAFAFGTPFNFGRFGEGIYSYRNPYMADRFATSCTSSPYRVLIACDVTVQPGQSGALDADEIAQEESIFVPVSEAIMPAYVIVYTK